MKLIKLLKGWREHAAGDLLTIDETLAASLVEKGIAAEYDPASDVDAQADAKALEEARRAEVKKAVDEALAAGKATDDKRGGHVITGADMSDPLDRDKKGGFAHMGQFLKDCRQAVAGDGYSNRLKQYTKYLEQLETKDPLGQAELLDSSGGFLVPEDMRMQLLEKTWAQSQFAQRCTNVPVASNNVSFPSIQEDSRTTGNRYGGVQVYWGAEAATRTASQVKFGKIRLELNKLFGLVYATDEILEDSAISMESVISNAFSNEFSFIIDEDILTGTGAGRPKGILKASSLVTAPAEAGQLAATIVWENILKMWIRMPARNRANAVWIVHQDAEYQLNTMQAVIGTAGQLVYLPPGGLSSSPYGSLMGRPVIVNEHSEAVGTVGDICLVDFTEYLLAQKTSGIQAASSIHVQFLTDQTAYRFTLRIDGQPWWPSAVTPYKGANTLSPFVALAAR